MMLTTQEAEQFFKLHSSLMGYLNQRLQIVPVRSPNKDGEVSRPGFQLWDRESKGVSEHVAAKKEGNNQS
jgi:hypothetical protein